MSRRTDVRAIFFDAGNTLVRMNFAAVADRLRALGVTVTTDALIRAERRARVLFPSGGWGLVRASNTNPYLTLRFEARTEAEIAAMKSAIYDALRRYPFVTVPAE